MNKDTRARVTDILLILMMVLPFVAVMALKVLTTPHSDEISISGALIYFTIPMPLMDLPIKKNVLLCCISRHGKILIPGGRDCVEIGDTVVVVTTNKGMNDFKDILA